MSRFKGEGEGRPAIILASQSRARQSMLRNAGLDFIAAPAAIDESGLTVNLLKQNASPAEIALKLAQEKALRVSNEHPGALVIGADQVLECEGRLIEKAGSRQEALEKLGTLRGKTHRLISAVVLVCDSASLWSCTDEANLTMRNFNDAFLQHYKEKAEEALTRSVGAYELENYGAWLFSDVKGDYFTILGLPLLPLLSHLCDHYGFTP